MNSLNQLAKASLLGTIELPHLPGQARDLSLPTDAEGMLMAAGILSLYQQAGLQLTSNDKALPEPCAEESLKHPPAQTINLFTEILNTEFPPLIRQGLEHFQRKSWHIPAVVLPRLLKLGAKYTDLHAHISSVAGERGRWLAQQNSGWRYLTHSTDKLDEALWEEGVFEERLGYLRQLRADNPEQAREKLASNFAAETAKHRVLLLNILAQDVSMQDEVFLQETLSDRSKEVTKLAASLLSRLLGSRLSQQARELLATCLCWKGVIKKHWDLEPPEEFSENLKALGIQENAQFGKNIGQRAAWLVQLIRLTPLDWWTETLERSPTELYSQAKKTTWIEAIRLGWRQAVLEQGNAVWAKALLQAGHLEGEALFILDVDDFAEVMQAFLEKDSKKFSGHFRQFINTTLKQQRCWTTSSSRAFLQAAQQHILKYKNVHYDYEFRKAIPSLACVLHSDVLAVAQKNWPQEAAHWGHFAEGFAEFSRFVQLRMELEKL